MFRSFTARAPRSTPSADINAIAIFGPTPLTPMSRWKKRRPASPCNPHSDQPPPPPPPAPHRGPRRELVLRPSAAHAEEPLEKAATGVVLKPVQRPAVLAHHQLGGEGDRLAHRGQALHHAQRHDDLVADAARGVDHHPIRLLGGETTGDLGDHVRRMYVSATATPSAASAGWGAALSRSSRATTRPICALGAAPAPATVFLMVAGAYSAIASPACSAASSTTPRAWPSTSVVRTFRW